MAARILVVEDEEKFARFIEMELTHEGYEVAKAFDSHTGLELAESGQFDLVLLDIMLPGLNGMEVLRRLRRSSSVPVIMLTARTASSTKCRGWTAVPMTISPSPSPLRSFWPGSAPPCAKPLCLAKPKS